MNIKFKPGPWRMEKVKVAHGSAFDIRGPNNDIIARDLSNAGPQDEATARLISAAAELYVAAVNALEVMKTGPEKDALLEALLTATAEEEK